jgi:hypothetical protein
MKSVKKGLRANEITTRKNTRPHQNIVGPQLRRLRCERGLSQGEVALQLQLKKHNNYCRETIAKIEAQTRCVRDHELPLFALVLGVSALELLPPASPPGRTLRSRAENFVPATVHAPVANQLNYKNGYGA